jgi:Surface lipoprotein assembly modifier
MNQPVKRTLALVVAGLLFGQAAPAASAGSATTKSKSKSPFSMELSAGVEHDSNVSVTEIDANTAADDYAAVIDADFNYRIPVEADTDLRLSYGFSQSLHDEFSEFDLQNHLLSADLSHDFGDVDAGATYRYIHTRLDNEAFLEMQQVSPYFSRFIGKKVFVRGDYTFTDKKFEDLGDRDADQHAIGGDIYFFIDGVRTYVVTGYKYKDEDARDSQFDYRSHNLKLRLARRFEVIERDATFKVSWLYEARDYKSITPLIGEKRNDDRNRLQAEVEVPVNDSFFVSLDYEYGDYSSDLFTADYKQHVVTLKAGFKM